jgi:cytochrome b6-f complex iron-sulfur subunit
MSEEVKKTEQKTEPESNHKNKTNISKSTTRRKFFTKAGWWAFMAVIGTATISSIRFLFPRVLFEPSPVYKIGYPDEYLMGTINSKWDDEYQVFILRNEEGYSAISARCTHLGCIVRWLEVENKFKCFCHGSGFYPDGINYEGPAPRPLERLKISLAEDGQIEIDRSIKFLHEKGEWGKPGSILKV